MSHRNIIALAALFICEMAAGTPTSSPLPTHGSASGRPKHSINMEQVVVLRSLCFTWQEISHIVGVSVKTLQRRAKEYGVTRFSSITDNELDDVVRNSLEDFPRAGEVMLRGQLISLDLRVPRQRLRDSLQRLGFRNSLPPAITRQTYSVPGPNALWHADGNHKLIRWRFIIHAAIDGYSRLVTYIQCSDNNRADTVIQYFLRATREYGIPSRVRTDLGGENARIWDFMEEVRGSNRGSYITGSSVHNTRIERFWRDVYEAVSATYVSVFNELENQSILDPLNDVDMFCLQYIFLPRINASLHSFQLTWNNHPLSTENSRSPIEIYTFDSLGSSLFQESDQAINVGPQDPDEQEDARSNFDYDQITVVNVPETVSPLNRSAMGYLTTVLDPLQSSVNHGIDLYLRCIHLVYQLLQDDMYN